MSLASGARLGPYEIVGPLGSGGMGEVYRARDTRLGRDVAIKVLPDEVAGDHKVLARFESEARAVAALSHPNILALYDVGDEKGVRYSVTELLEGETLREALRRGALPVRRALEISEQLAKGLAAAHEKGILHRDVKPENVFLTKGGDAKLLDFGLARQTILPSDPDDTHSPTEPVLSTAGAVVGTVAYMSPEQARGLPLDHRSDQFSLGIVLYEMLAGQRPFIRDSAAETLTAIIREEPEPLERSAAGTPAPVRFLVERLLTKEPEGRYDSTRDLARDLATWKLHPSGTSGEAASATDIVPGGTPRLHRRIPFWTLAGVVALAVAVGLFVGLRFVRSGSPPGHPVSLAFSFPLDAEPGIVNHNPFVLSPDGKTLVYAGRTNPGRLKLFVRRLESDEIRPIPGTDGAYWDFPFISPDGLEVGFFADGKLKKVALVGGLPIALWDAPHGRGGSWGTDGTIVFAPGPGSGLLQVPASGGEPRRVTTPDTAKGERHFSPQILPDGEHVLFELWDPTGTSHAAVVSLRTGKLRIVVEDAAYPRYLPTGHLVFTRPGVLFGVPFSLKRLETSGSPMPLLNDLVTNSNYTRAAVYTFSQEGTLVYAPTRQLQRTLVWVDRKGAAELIPFPPGGYAAVALSPDGGRFATITAERAERWALLFGDIARGTLSRSAADGTFQGLAWAPDGKRVAFGFGPGGRTKNSFWQSTDEGTPPERLSSEMPFRQEHPSSFAPDGRVLLFSVHNAIGTSATNTRWDIFALSLSGERKLLPFLQTEFNEEAARFSPDGRWVVYHSNESGRWEVFVRPFPASAQRWQLSTEGGVEPCWSRNGREVFYRIGDKMMGVHVETKPTFRAERPRTLFEVHYLSYDASSYDVAPDGNRFLMIKADPAESGPPRVKVVLNWFEEVKRRVPMAK